jgi:hypothetical protein
MGLRDVQRCFPLLSAAVLASGPASALELEFPVHGGIVMPTRGDPSLAPAGPIAGLTPLLRLNQPIAVGALLEHSRLAWRARGVPGEVQPGAVFPDNHGSFQTTLLAGAFRWYVVDVRPVHPYVQLAIGYLDHQQRPDHPDCSTEGPVGGRLSAGGDFAFHSWGRLGLAAAVFPFALGQSCTGLAYEGRPPDPPFPGLGVSLQMGFTTVWDPARGE